jgi:hypothetical protein
VTPKQFTEKLYTVSLQLLFFLSHLPLSQRHKPPQSNAITILHAQTLVLIMERKMSHKSLKIILEVLMGAL